MLSPAKPLSILCVEDNPLLVMQLECLIEDAGHLFAGSAASFDEVRALFDSTCFHLALIDIDLADGRTGGEICEWLNRRGRPSLFITGQDQLAPKHAHCSLGAIAKPISEERLRDVLSELQQQFARGGPGELIGPFSPAP